MNITQPYQVAPNIAVRRERFGALVYNYDNRRLFFLHSHEVADLVLGLDGKRPVGEAVETFLADQVLPETAGAMLLRTLNRLEAIGVVAPVTSA